MALIVALLLWLIFTLASYIAGAKVLGSTNHGGGADVYGFNFERVKNRAGGRDARDATARRHHLVEQKGHIAGGPLHLRQARSPEFS